ncbi:transposase [Haemophilus influenzae 6P18H1]|uniref:hypothetical protein n=1 Tax=Haemophilus influenzae TaxID=727 RepID=UPI0001A3F909|nr:hypothetical protein [Haemophilus influenzae]EEP47033.1 transposase [Haemophilus influenzae 6P18H1]
MEKDHSRIKANHPEYGYRRVHASLPGVNHKKVQRLKTDLGASSAVKKKARNYKTYRGPIRPYWLPNRLGAEIFLATAPQNQKRG